jgi:YHS domain-containing protein
MASMDQSYLVELDTNLSPTILMKQLLLRLQSYPISKAAKPLRMSEPVDNGEEGEEGGGGGGEFIDGEIEDILNTMQSKRRLAAKFKWRRSKCSYYCPVSLKDGRIMNGKAEFAASFLDKMYMMADENALKEFLKNPRPYLRLPQPRAPCKLSILGPKFSGKTTLCATLAKKYNAKVIDMSLLVEPEQKRYKDELIQKTRVETTQAVVDQIKQKFQQKLDKERIKRDQEAADRAAAAEAQLQQQQQDDQENEQGETGSAGGENQPPQDENQPPPPPPVATTDEMAPPVPDEMSNVDKYVYLSEEGDIIVSQDHPEIESAVKKALDEASKSVIEIQPSDYVRILLSEIDKIRKERAKLDPLAPT